MFLRILLFVVGLSVLSTGISCVTNAHLGTGAVSSTAYVLSLGTGLTMGFYVFLTNAFFFLIEIAIEPKEILKKAVFQLPICALFGFVIDVAMWVTSFIHPEAYWEQLVMVCVGTAMIGIGAGTMVFARFAILPPEGAVLAFIGRWGGSFETLRSGADCFLVALAVLLSFYFFGELRGIREGTVIAALGGGNVAKFVISGWNHLLPKIRVTDK